MFGRRRKKNKGEVSALYRLHLNFEESVELLGKIGDQIGTDILAGRISESAKDKMSGFLILTKEVEKTVSAYDAILKEYFNLDKIEG